MRRKDIQMSPGSHWVIEDFLKILGNEPIEERRREYILNSLSEDVARAIKGIEISRSNSLYIGSANQKAFYTFLFLHDLFKEREGWEEQLSGVLAAFESLRAHKEIDPENRKNVEEIFSILFDCAKSNQRHCGIPQFPKKLTGRIPQVPEGFGIRHVF